MKVAQLIQVIKTINHKVGIIKTVHQIRLNQILLKKKLFYYKPMILNILQNIVNK